MFLVEIFRYWRIVCSFVRYECVLLGDFRSGLLITFISGMLDRLISMREYELFEMFNWWVSCVVFFSRCICVILM